MPFDEAQATRVLSPPNTLNQQLCSLAGQPMQASAGQASMVGEVGRKVLTSRSGRSRRPSSPLWSCAVALCYSAPPPPPPSIRLGPPTTQITVAHTALVQVSIIYKHWRISADRAHMLQSPDAPAADSPSGQCEAADPATPVTAQHHQAQGEVIYA